MSTPFFSVIIPTFNRSRLVLDAVRSVLAQTDRDFEVLVVDNGSTDDTQETIQSLDDSRVRYLWRNASGGPAWPRNKGIEHARGSWFCFLDSDDSWHETKLACVRSAIETNQKVSMLIHWQEERNAEGERVSVLKPNKLCIANYRSCLLRENTIVTSSVTVRGEFVRKFDLRFKESSDFIAVEDYDFWLNVLFHDGKLVCIDKVLGVMNSPPQRSGTTDVFMKALPTLFDHHVYSVQNFTKDKKALLKRLLASHDLRRAFSALRNRQIRYFLCCIQSSLVMSPTELPRYLCFRLWSRLSGPVSG